MTLASTVLQESAYVISFHLLNNFNTLKKIKQQQQNKQQTSKQTWEPGYKPEAPELTRQLIFPDLINLAAWYLLKLIW